MRRMRGNDKNVGGDSEMDGKGTNVKNDSVEKTETGQAKCGANWKKIAGILVVVIILLNTLWNMTESKITETVAKDLKSLPASEEIESFKTEFKSDLANLDARVTETAKGTIDLDAVKKDIESIKKAGEEFEKKLLAVIKAEELKLIGLEKSIADQKAYIDQLKSLLEGAVK